MNHNRDSTVSSIVDLYGTADHLGPQATMNGRSQYSDFQEEEEDQAAGPAGILASSSFEVARNGPTEQSSTNFPTFDPALAPPLELDHRDLHMARSTITSTSSYAPSSRQRQDSNNSSSIPGGAGSSLHQARGGRAVIGIKGNYNESAASFVSVQQPGEEDDAFHVRSTCKSDPMTSSMSSDQPLMKPYHSTSFADARLEVQGVYGDGWDEGIERTRERAIVKRRTSDPPAQRGDTLSEKEKQALSRVDR